MDKNIRIAIADDHKLFGSGLNKILAENSHFLVVQNATNGRELLDGLADSRPDVILLDLEMPVLSGREALKAIRETDSGIKVIMLTMHNNKKFILQMMELGANGYLLKDTDPVEVITAVDKVTTSGYYFSDKVSLAMLQGIAEPKTTVNSLDVEHGLTQREIDVLRLICKQYTTAEIGDTLFLSPKTIEGYRKTLMEKTASKNMAGLVIFAVKHGLFTEV